MNYAFHPELVAPFYGSLMNGNFLRKEIRESNPLFFEQFAFQLPLYQNKDLIRMLNESWRPQKVSAWVVGLRKIDELQTIVTEKLFYLEDHVENFVMSLILLNNQESLKSLEKFIIHSFNRKNITVDTIDSLARTLGWAISGANILSKTLNIKLSFDAEHGWHSFPQHWWDIISKEWPKAQRKVEDRWLTNWSLIKYDNEVKEIIRYCRSEFAYQ